MANKNELLKDIAVALGATVTDKDNDTNELLALIRDNIQGGAGSQSPSATSALTFVEKVTIEENKKSNTLQKNLERGFYVMHLVDYFYGYQSICTMFVDTTISDPNLDIMSSLWIFESYKISISGSNLTNLNVLTYNIETNTITSSYSDPIEIYIYKINIV